ncbi:MULTISPECIES: heme ABC transporter ATP-binding protein [unclassified Marinobacter]|uniref:heme ABC transporter ATP-binding protein n=1 Tax=unclassified Marinobacter TaxID=83889 RepID=UPI0019265864|nr:MULTISPECIES: heme ABC transporter ATP-binding protein [unclassified Marinobacter]MBL3827078.1 heme ABC transporter ATP-binding protein [Marinobacter sp. MC3]MBL3895584.1 heme ABC transporter ATP-binding protein [Marinobacter sp. MW3]
MVLSVNKVSVSLERSRIVDGIDCHLKAGELLMLLGPNGAGKSTLLKAISGDLPYGGSVTLSGRELGQWRPERLARQRAVMPQRVEVNFPLTVEEVVQLGRPKMASGRSDLVVDELMNELDIGHLRHRLVPGLSGGEQQRLQLARVLAQIIDSPGDRLLLLDECTSALDPAHQQMVLDLVRRLAKAEGMAVLAVVHDLNLAAQFADRLLVMKAGRRVHEGSAREVLTPELLDTVYGFTARVVELEEGYPMVVPRRRGPSGAYTAPVNPSCRQAS